MSTTTNTTEGTSPVVANPAATPAASATAITRSASAAELVAAFDGATLAAAVAAASGANPPKIEGVTSPAPAAATDYAPPAEQAPAATPPADPAAPAPEPGDDNPQPEKLGKFRTTAKNFKHAELLTKFKDPSVDEVDAMIEVYGAKLAERLAQKGAPVTSAKSPETASAAAPVAPAPAPAPIADVKLTEAKTRLAALEAQLSDGEVQADLSTTNKILREINKVERTIERETERAEAEALAAQKSQADATKNTFRQREAAVAQEVYSTFPKLGDATSAEHAEFKQFIALKDGDPDYASIFASPRWPKVLAAEFAEVKGWGKAAAPASATGTPAPKPGAPAAPRVTAAEVLTPGSNQGGSGALDARSALAALREQGSEALFKALNSVTR